MIHNNKIYKPDYILMTIIGIIIVFGLTMLSSASAAMAYQKFQDSYHFLKRQIIIGLIPGLILFFLFFNIDYRKWKKISLPLLVFSLLLLIAVFLPFIGFSHGGSRRWISLGGFVFQPSELMKLTLLLYLAALFEKRLENIKNFSYGFLPFLILLGIISLLIILQPDIGTLFIIAITATIIFFAAGGRFLHLAFLGLMSFSTLAVLIKIAPYRMARFTVFLNPEIDPRGIGYHINQALLAIGSGGIFGLGLGNSRQKFLYLPEVSGDSIFAVIAEELGFIFTTGLIILFVILTLRGFKIAKKSPDVFGKLVAVGITSWFVFQAFINIGAMLGLLPLTGLPLPFVSYGGSAMVVSLMAFGILMNISKQTRE